MRALLDTHAFVLLTQQGVETFSRRTQKLLEDNNNDFLLSAVSITELAVKSSINKIKVKASDIARAIDDLRLIVIAFEPHHAMKMFDLPLHHRDPFDRMLISTALAEGVPIITRDREFAKYRGLEVIS